ncbi:MAG: ribonuclease P protein component 1 [Candidatus Micrarchaeia archaeon]
MWGYNNKTIVLHELIGLDVKVLKSSDRFVEGVEGTVVDETKNLLVIRTRDGNKKKIIKKACKFAFKVEGIRKRFVVDGKEINFRSYERTEKALKYYKKRNI